MIAGILESLIQSDSAIMACHGSPMPGGFGRISDSQALEFLEVCAGRHALSTAAADKGILASAYDSEYSRHMNLETAMGMVLLFSLARRMSTQGHATRSIAGGREMAIFCFFL